MFEGAKLPAASSVHTSLRTQDLDAHRLVSSALMAILRALTFSSLTPALPPIMPPKGEESNWHTRSDTRNKHYSQLRSFNRSTTFSSSI
jgi:hypothetical protein